LALSFFNKEDFRLSIQWFRKAKQISPNHFQTRLHLGLSLLKHGDKKQAI